MMLQHLKELIFIRKMRAFGPNQYSLRGANLPTAMNYLVSEVFILILKVHTNDPVIILIDSQ